MNYPPQVRKEIKAFQKMKKDQAKEMAKVQATERKLASQVEALTEKHTMAKIAVMKLQKAHVAAMGTPMSRLVVLCQRHGLVMSNVIAAANQFDMKRFEAPSSAPSDQQDPV
jgi:hypothetical protein